LLRREDRDVGSGEESTVLVGIAVDRVIQEVGPDAAVVEERVAFARRPVARDALALPLGVDQEPEQVSLGLADALLERRVGLQTTETRVDLPLPKGDDSLSDWPRGIAEGASPDAERSTVRPEFLDVKDRQPVPGEDALDREEGEVREVLMVDGIELLARDESRDVRKLDRDRPRRLKEN
jgi:hypothetical protein